jgi:hypothetical protein
MQEGNASRSVGRGKDELVSIRVARGGLDIGRPSMIRRKNDSPALVLGEPDGFSIRDSNLPDGHLRIGVRERFGFWYDYENGLRIPGSMDPWWLGIRWIHLERMIIFQIYNPLTGSVDVHKEHVLLVYDRRPLSVRGIEYFAVDRFGIRHPGFRIHPP